MFVRKLYGTATAYSMAVRLVREKKCRDRFCEKDSEREKRMAVCYIIVNLFPSVLPKRFWRCNGRFLLLVDVLDWIFMARHLRCIYT